MKQFELYLRTILLCEYYIKLFYGDKGGKCRLKSDGDNFVTFYLYIEDTN